MKQKLATLALLTLVCGTMIAQTTIEGRWKTVEDNKPKSIVKISKEGDSYVGEIVQLFTLPPTSICEKCEGQLKDKPLIGLKILYGMVADGKNKFSGGQIIDPKTGKIYYCKATLENNGKSLKVRGSLDTFGLAGRTQTWERISQ